MKLKHREVAAAMTAVLRDCGVPFRLEFRGKHPALVFSVGGKTHRVTMAWSPSDHRSLMNGRALVKRLVKQGTTTP